MHCARSRDAYIALPDMSYYLPYDHFLSYPVSLLPVVYQPYLPSFLLFYWEVSNARSGSCYALLPGAGDGNADEYGVGDV